MSYYIFKLPADFDDYEWEVTAKGCFLGAILWINDVVYHLNFYDATRLAQEVNDELRNKVVFFEANILILRSVDKKSMTEAVEKIMKSGDVKFLSRSHVVNEG